MCILKAGSGNGTRSHASRQQHPWHPAGPASAAAAARAALSQTRASTLFQFLATNSSMPLKFRILSAIAIELVIAESCESKSLSKGVYASIRGHYSMLRAFVVCARLMIVLVFRNRLGRSRHPRFIDLRLTVVRPARCECVSEARPRLLARRAQSSLHIG